MNNVTITLTKKEAELVISALRQVSYDAAQKNMNSKEAAVDAVENKIFNQIKTF